MQAAVTEYFRVWNAHDEPGIEALHATASTLTDWDAAHGALSALLWHTRRPSSQLVPLLPCCLRRALLLPPPPADRMLLSPSPGPTNAEVATGIAGIWKAVPKIQIEVVSIFTCGEAKSCVANIKVIVDETLTTLTLTLNPNPNPNPHPHPHPHPNVKVIVDETTTLNVCDVFTFDQDFKVVSIVAYKAD